MRTDEQRIQVRTTSRALLMILVSAVLAVFITPALAKAETTAPRTLAAVTQPVSLAVHQAPARGPDHHLRHLDHLRHLAHETARPHVALTAVTVHGSGALSSYPAAGIYTFSMLESVWIAAGGPGWAAYDMAMIAECESGGNTLAYNPSGASGLWQILGVPFPGNPFNGPTNALMAVAKFMAPEYPGGPAMGMRPWVCQP